MTRIALVLVPLLAFLAYCLAVLVYRGRVERRKERQQGLDHLRRWW